MHAGGGGVVLVRANKRSLDVPHAGGGGGVAVLSLRSLPCVYTRSAGQRLPRARITVNPRSLVVLEDSASRQYLWEGILPVFLNPQVQVEAVWPRSRIPPTCGKQFDSVSLVLSHVLVIF